VDHKKNRDPPSPRARTEKGTEKRKRKEAKRRVRIRARKIAKKRARRRARRRAKTRENILNMTKALSAKATVIPARRSRDAEPRQPPAAQHLPVKHIVSLIKSTLMFNKFFFV
jgi:hypothetical protein